LEKRLPLRDVMNQISRPATQCVDQLIHGLKVYDKRTESALIRAKQAQGAQFWPKFFSAEVQALQGHKLTGGTQHTEIRTERQVW